MKILYRFIAFLVAIAFLSFTVTAQSKDKAGGAYAKAVEQYHESLSPETGLYNGIEYIDYAYTIQEGSPFFGLTPFDSGSVVYENMLYRNVLLAFDIVKSNVVIYDASRLHKIVLNSRNVNDFVASGHQFTHLTKDSANAADMTAGFYEVLYDGPSRVLKKEKRTVQESLSTPTFSKRYVTYASDFYIRKGNTYHSINSKAALFSLFKDKQKEVQKQLKKKKLKFKRDKNRTLAEAAAYYDMLVK